MQNLKGTAAEGQVSYADLIALGGAYAVSVTGGPAIDVPIGGSAHSLISWQVQPLSGTSLLQHVWRDNRLMAFCCVQEGRMQPPQILQTVCLRRHFQLRLSGSTLRPRACLPRS